MVINTIAGPAVLLTDVNGGPRPLEDIEADVVAFTVAVTRKRTDAMKALGIPRSTFYRVLRRLGLMREPTVAP